MTMPQIRHDVPEPTTLVRLLSNLRVGDSFETGDVGQNSVLVTAKRIGVKITTKRTDGGLIRVWRIQ